MRKSNKLLIVTISLLVINGCSFTEDPKPKLDFPTVKVLPKRTTSNIYFEEVDSNKTHTAGSLDTANAQHLWTTANIYKYDSEFYRNQLIEIQKFFTTLQPQSKE